MPRWGKLQAQGGLGISAPPVTVQADLGAMGLGAQEDVFGARADFKWGLTHLVVAVQQSAHEGTGTLTGSVSGGGTTIPAGTSVDSRLDLGIASGTLLFDLLPGDLWELGVGFGLGALEIDAEIEEIGSGNAVSTDELLPYPLVAGVVGVRLGSLEVAALGQGIAGEADGDEIQLIDLDAFARWRFLGGARHVRGSLVAGYRLVLIEAEYGSGGEDVDADFDLAGPYVGFEITL